MNQGSPNKADVNALLDKYKQRKTDAANQLMERAKQGDPESQFRVGYDYYLKSDYGYALEWLSKAGGGGHAEAQHNLGNMYEIGQGVAQDYNRALEWYGKAANQGNRDAHSKYLALQKRMEKMKGITI